MIAFASSMDNSRAVLLSGVADTANAFQAFGLSDQDDSKTARELSIEDANAIIDAAGYIWTF